VTAHASRLSGARVAAEAGTDFGGGSARANMLPWEFESLVESGLRPWEALASVTWRGGVLLGEPDAGVIRESGPADFSFSKAFLVPGSWRSISLGVADRAHRLEAVPMRVRIMVCAATCRFARISR
jgi:hypothetical protein